MQDALSFAGPSPVCEDRSIPQTVTVFNDVLLIASNIAHLISETPRMKFRGFEFRACVDCRIQMTQVAKSSQRSLGRRVLNVVVVHWFPTTHWLLIEARYPHAADRCVG